ncbi:MAG: orotidine-5'-phosphate decarboxylase [Cytophagaceae bacterium]|nr:orotidine-5'-phosphate decarboxylase [Cytophagaceae bacterium]
MTRSQLFARIQSKKSYLCVGLDTDPRRIPTFLRSEKDPVFAFNQRIIDATSAHAVAYKPNLAFYEAQGARGWESLQKTLEYIPTDCFTIADAKRGDIGNTSGLYARAFFDKTAAGLDFDAVTVAPYMGRDSVTPFLDFPGKWVILLALTSNPGSEDLQQLRITNYELRITDDETQVRRSQLRIEQPLFERVIQTAQTWATSDQLMFVVGATQAESLTRIRELAPDNFLLVPGVGAQGGSLEEVSKYGMNAQCGLLVNASRSILYASTDAHFAEAAGAEAHRMQQEMTRYLDAYLPV